MGFPPLCFNFNEIIFRVLFEKVDIQTVLFSFMLKNHIPLFWVLEIWNQWQFSSLVFWNIMCCLLWYSDVFTFVVHKQLDRFIPNRSAIDFDYAHYMLMEGRKGKENPPASSPSREAYRKHLAETFNMNRTRILAFKNKPPAPVELFPPHFFSSQQQDKPTKPKRSIPQVGLWF